MELGQENLTLKLFKIFPLNKNKYNALQVLIF